MRNNKVLTENQKDTYVAQDGKYCPYCKEDNLYFVEDYEGTAEIRQRIVCKSCDKQWWDIYALNGIEEINEN